MSPQHEPVTAAAPDEALVRAHLAGDADAFSELYRRYFPALVAWAAPRTANGAAAEDVAQDTLLCAVRYLHTFDLNRPLWPWLRRIAAHALGRALVHSVATPLAEVPETPVPGPDEGSHHRTTAMHEALATLPARTRTALWMRYGEDRSAAEVAETFGMTTNALDQMMFRARRRLRDEVRRVEAAFAGLALPAAFVRFLRRRTKPTPASATKWTLPATMVPALTLAVGGGVAAPVFMLHGGGHHGSSARLPRITPAESVSYRTAEDRSLNRLARHRAVFMHLTTGSQPTVAVANGPAEALVQVTPDPGKTGKVEEDRISIKTPFGAITTSGHVTNTGADRLLCRVATCSHLPGG
jgi:RNA polymerase sigma-70 factor (ECF subfamily)